MTSIPWKKMLVRRKFLRWNESCHSSSSKKQELNVACMKILKIWEWSSLNTLLESASGPIWNCFLNAKNNLFCNRWKKQQIFESDHYFFVEIQTKIWNWTSTIGDPYNHADANSSFIVSIQAIFIELFQFEIGWSFFQIFENFKKLFQRAV